MEEENKSREEVSAYIKLVDERREKWSHFLYGVDWKCSSYYDIVFNLEKINIDIAADVITKVICQKPFQSDYKSLKILNNLHLESKAKALLQQSPRTRGSEVEIEADAESGSLNISGDFPKVGSRIWESDIRSVLSKMKEIKNIEVKKSIVNYYE